MADLVVKPLTDTQRTTFLTELGRGASMAYSARQAKTTKAYIAKIVNCARAAENRLAADEALNPDDLEDYERWAMAMLAEMEMGQGGLEMRLADAVINAAEVKGKWQAAAWMLERLNPERWTLRKDDPAPRSGATNIGTAIIVGTNADEEIMRRAERLTELAAQGAAEIAAAKPVDLGHETAIETSSIDAGTKEKLEAFADDGDDLGY